MEKEIKGVTHPIPTEYAERIYKTGKNVFVGKSHLGKVSKGDKFIIYESHGAKAYTGWADVIQVVKMKPSDILNKFKNQLMVTEEEFKEYAKGRTEMNVIEFENFQMFNKKVVPKRFVGISGKYIYGDEFKLIEKNKG
ncbi:MAG: DUF365 domain-containing protein [Methanobacteriaceae archaeon]|jgi:hypothetical protein|nr:DUF365 domain-containing protein [Methanobacteriaceae archaeon]